MSDFKVMFETPLNQERGEFATKFMDNIKSNFEKRLSLGKTGKIVAITYKVNGDKTTGHKLTASVTYESGSEIHPLVIWKSARWKPVYDKDEWHKRTRRLAKRKVEEKYGKEKAEEMFPI